MPYKLHDFINKRGIVWDFFTFVVELFAHLLGRPVITGERIANLNYERLKVKKKNNW